MSRAILASGLIAEVSTHQISCGAFIDLSCSIVTSESPHVTHVVSQESSSSWHIGGWDEVSSLGHSEECEAGICAIVSTDCRVVGCIWDIVDLSGLGPEDVIVLLQGLYVMHPLVHG